jgi:hypothetical protein
MSDALEETMADSGAHPPTSPDAAVTFSRLVNSQILDEARSIGRCPGHSSPSRREAPPIPRDGGEQSPHSSAHGPA